MPRSIQEIQTLVHGIENQIEQLDQDHDGQADLEQNNYFLRQCHNELIALGKELQETIVIQKKKALLAAPQPGSKAAESSVGFTDKDGVKMGVKTDSNGNMELSLGQKEEDKANKTSTSVGFTLSKEKFAAEWCKEKTLWDLSPATAITIGSVGPLPILLKPSTSGKVSFKLSEEVKAAEASIGVTGTFTATGDVALYTSLGGVIEVGGKATLSIPITASASLKLANSDYTFEINPCSAQISLAFTVFIRPSKSVAEAAKAVGIDISGISKTLASYKLVTISVPKIVNGQLSGSPTFAKGEDVDKLIAEVESIYNTVKEKANYIGRKAEEFGHDVSEWFDKTF